MVYELVAYHDCFAVASQSVRQELGQLRISIGYFGVLSARVISQCRDDVAKRRQGEIDGSTFFQAIASSASLVGSLTTGQIDQVDDRRLGHFFTDFILVLLNKVDGDDRMSSTWKVKNNHVKNGLKSFSQQDRLMDMHLLVAFMLVAAIVL